MANPTCETCAHGDKPSEAEPCNRCAVVDGFGSRLPVRWVAKVPTVAPAPATTALCDWCRRDPCWCSR